MSTPGALYDTVDGETAFGMSDRVEQLCRRAGDGDPAAASELVMLHYERIYIFLRRLCGSDSDAEDLTQKAFAKMWPALSGYAGRSTFSTWMHGIARNTYVDWRRKGNRLEARSEEWWAECAAEGPSPLDHAADRDEAMKLYALVEQLEDEARQAIHLHYYQGLSLQETASVLEMPVSTLKYQLRQSVNQLKSKLAEPAAQTGQPAQGKGNSHE